MLNFTLDSDEKTVKMTIRLKGEEKDLELNIEKYKIIKENNKLYLDIKGLNTNREWLNILIQKQLKNTKIEIPEQYEALLHIVL
jgi:hypothetical protein